MKYLDADRIAEIMDPHSPISHEVDWSRLDEESEASAEHRKIMYARERELARQIVDDPYVSDREFSYRMGRLTYANVRQLVKIQMDEKGKS